jgi:uncharacterized membrane protein
MADLIVIVYPAVAQADEVRQRLARLQKEYPIALDDAVIAAPTKDGKVRLDHLMNRTATGAISCSFWGLFLGALFLSPLIGGSKGEASDTVAAALTAVGIRDSFIRKLAASLTPGSGALFLLVRTMTADRVLKEIESFGGVVLKTSLVETREEVLRHALQHAKEIAAAEASSR